jgi:hypothetical protein
MVKPQPGDQSDKGAGYDLRVPVLTTEIGGWKIVLSNVSWNLMTRGPVSDCPKVMAYVFG